MKKKNQLAFLNIKYLLAFSVILLFVIGISIKEEKLHSKFFSLKSIDNQIMTFTNRRNQIEIKELKGKVVFLKVFGWNCPYCQKEIPELIQLKNRFSTDFETVAIQKQNYTNQENLDFIKKYHINYLIINGKSAKEFMQYLKDTYHWDGVIPLTIVLSPKGKILAFEVGAKSYNLTQLLQSTLKNIDTVAVEESETK